MLRRSPNKSLTLFQIADDWSREIQPARSLDELLNELVMAWWGGELDAASGPTRLKLLKALFKTGQTEIPFWVKGADFPQTSWELADGGVEILIFPVLQIPSKDPEAWTDEECEAAYGAIAEHWRDSCFDLISPLVTDGISLFEPSFAQWIAACGHTRPEFWLRPQSNLLDPTLASVPAPAAASDLPLPPKPPLRRRGPPPVKLMRVKKAIYDEAKLGKIKIQELMAISEEALAAQHDVSRDTIRRAKNNILAEIVEDKNLD